jgi:hypothetical protein
MVKDLSLNVSEKETRAMRLRKKTRYGGTRSDFLKGTCLLPVSSLVKLISSGFPTVLRYTFPSDLVNKYYPSRPSKASIEVI